MQKQASVSGAVEGEDASVEQMDLLSTSENSRVFWDLWLSATVAQTQPLTQVQPWRRKEQNQYLYVYEGRIYSNSLSLLHDGCFICWRRPGVRPCDFLHLTIFHAAHNWPPDICHFLLCVRWNLSTCPVVDNFWDWWDFLNHFFQTTGNVTACPFLFNSW